MATTTSLGKFSAGLIILTLTAVFANHREIHTRIDPGCDASCGDGIGYYQAVGSSDDIHYLVSSIGLPTLLVLHTESDAAVQPTIDWPKLLSKNQSEIQNSITFDSEKIIYSYAVVFTKLYEYNDTKDTGDMSDYSGNKTQWNTYNFSDVLWDAVGENSDVNANKLMIKATQRMNTSFENGTFTFAFHAFDHEARQDGLPHLQYNENNTLIDFLIDHVRPAFTKSRFALEAVIISQDEITDNMYIGEEKSIDDEYTPGVFSIINWVTKSGSSMNRAYAQWKPICYKKSDRSRMTATKMKYSALVNSSHFDIDTLKQTIAFAYFGDKLMDIAMRGTNLSFGLSEDGTYTKTNFMGWSFLVGVGDPPVDRISVLVISVISTGLGLPVIFMIFGGAFLCYKKRKDKKIMMASGHSSVN